MNKLLSTALALSLFPVAFGVATNAKVSVKITAKNNVLGVVGVDRNVFSRTVEADSQGNFSFSFQPSGVVPGTRYEISFSASKGNLTKQETLTLVQR